MINTVSNSVPRIVVVGGGFAGLEVTRGLKNERVAITLIDRTNHHTFQPLLYQVATAGLSPADIGAPIRNIFRKQRNVDVVMAEVTDVDTRAQNVILGDRLVPYDYLVLATGAWHSYFGHDEWEPYAPGLKTLTDATMIRRKILLAFEAAEVESDAMKRAALLTFLLVGGGPTGVEMAGAIAELAHRALAEDFRHINPRDAKIILVEAGPKILNAYPDDLSQKTVRKLNEMGVEVRTGTPVTQIDDEGVIAGGARIMSHNVIWTAGVMASPIAKWLHLPKDAADRAGRVKVAPNLSVPGLPNVFVVGDAAAFEQEGKQVPGVAPNAIQMGKFVARLLKARLHNQTGSGSEEEPAHYHYLNKGDLATVGRSFAVFNWHGIKLSGFIAWAMWLGIHIFYLIGFANRILVLVQWAWAYFTFQRGVRLISPNADQEGAQAKPMPPIALAPPASLVSGDGETNREGQKSPESASAVLASPR